MLLLYNFRPVVAALSATQSVGVPKCLPILDFKLLFSWIYQYIMAFCYFTQAIHRREFS